MTNMNQINTTPMKTSEIKKYINVEPYRRRYRYLWLKRELRRRGLGRIVEDRKDREYGFDTHRDCYDHARRILEDEMAQGQAERNMDPVVKEKLMVMAFGLIRDGISPTGALELGGEQLKSQDASALVPIGQHWEAYFISKTTGESPAWVVKRNQKAERAFFNRERSGIFAETVGTFAEVSTGREALKAMFARNPSWRARGTAIGKLSALRLYLDWLEGQKAGECLEEDRIKAICNPKKVLPDGLAAEQANYAATVEQAASLIEWARVGKHALCGWVVFKLFCGARTEFIQKWKWSIVDFEKGVVTVPRNLTKMKQADQRYELDEIPYLRAGLLWARAQDNVTSDNQRIVPVCQGTVSEWKKRWMNSHKEIFAYQDANGNRDLTKPIVPKETHKNMERSAFISYGSTLAKIKGSGITGDSVGRIAEDTTCWDSYIDHGTQLENGTLATEARAYFKLLEDFLENGNSAGHDTEIGR